MKTCNGPCGQTKEDSEFYVKRLKSGALSLRAYCKPCGKTFRDAWRASSPKDNDRNKAYNFEHRERIKYQRLVKYWPGCTWQQARDNYLALMILQNHACAICSKRPSYVHPKSGKTRELAVDHHHASGKVRGLLCGSCNRAIGLLEDDREVIEQTLIYINKAAA